MYASDSIFTQVVQIVASALEFWFYLTKDCEMVNIERAISELHTVYFWLCTMAWFCYNKKFISGIKI
mgnify:CR=1 FL=1